MARQSPWLFIEVDFLPPLTPSAEEAENGQLFAEHVRAEMGHVTTMPLHSMGARELRKEMKEQMEAAKAKEVAKKGGAASELF